MNNSHGEPPFPSWPGLSRPSTSACATSPEIAGTLSKTKHLRFASGARRAGVDARDKPGHDGWRWGFEFFVCWSALRQTNSMTSVLMRPR